MLLPGIPRRMRIQLIASVQCGACGERVWGGKMMMDLARFGSCALEGAWAVSGEWILPHS